MQKIVIYSIIIVFLFFTKNLIAQDSTTVKETKKQKRENARLAKFRSKVNSDSVYFIPYSDISSLNKVGKKRNYHFNSKSPSHYLAFLISPTEWSIPVGSFGKMDYNETEKIPGFAMNGKNKKLEAAYYFYKGIGLQVSYGTQTHNYNNKKYTSALGISNPKFSQFNYYISDENPIMIEYNNPVKNWENNYLMVGPIYSIKVGRRLTLDVKASLGSSKITKPSTFGYFAYYTPRKFFTDFVPGQTYIMSTSATAKGIGYGFGSSVRFNVINNLALMMGVDFLQSTSKMSYYNYKATYEALDLIYINPINEKIQVTKNYSFNTVNITIGLALQLNRKK